MRTLLAILSVLGLLFTVGGCATPFEAPVFGGVVTNNVKGPVTGVDNSVSMKKVGTAEAQSIVFFAQGDASIKRAMESAEITKVHHVDSETFSVLGVYARYKTIVYGE